MTTLLDEIKTTYRDCQPDIKVKTDWRRVEPIRRLEWKADVAVSGEELKEALLAMCEGYNSFEPLPVYKAIIQADPSSKVFIAREGSVVFISLPRISRLCRKLWRK